MPREKAAKNAVTRRKAGKDIQRMVFVVVLYLFEQLRHRLLLFGAQFLRVGGDAFEFGAEYLEAVFFQIFLDGRIGCEVAVKYHGIFIFHHFVHAVVDEFQFEVVQRHAVLGGNLEHALVVEHEHHRAARAQRAAVLVEIAADVGHRAGGVVRGGLHDDGDAPGAVTFVHHFLVVAFLLRGGLLDGAFHVFLRHVLLLGLLHEHAQAGIAVGVGAALAGRYRDLLTQLGKHAGHVAPTFQFRRFSIFKGSSHINND